MIEGHESRQGKEDGYILHDYKDKLRRLPGPLRPQNGIRDRHSNGCDRPRKDVDHGAELALVQDSVGKAVRISLVLSSVEEWAESKKMDRRTEVISSGSHQVDNLLPIAAAEDGNEKRQEHVDAVGLVKILDDSKPFGRRRIVQYQH